MRDDPCFSCALPECDDSSPACNVRRLLGSYQRKLRGKQHDLITSEERDAWNRVFRSWYLDRCAEASEGGRPYKRWEHETRAKRRREDGNSFGGQG